MNNSSTNIKKALEWIAVDWGTTNLRVWANDYLVAEEGFEPPTQGL